MQESGITNAEFPRHLGNWQPVIDHLPGDLLLELTNPIQVGNLDRPSPPDLIRLFDYPGDFVPVIVGQGDDSTEQSPSHVIIDKPALSLRLARAYVADLLNKAWL